MRKLRLLTLFIVLAVVAMSAMPALGAPAQRFPIGDETFPELNPCTGLVHNITLTDQVLVIHDDVDPKGGNHVTGTITGKATTDDGFSGRFTFWFGGNVDLTSHTGLVEFTDTLNVTLRDGSGAVILVSEVVHLTMKDGIVKSFFDNFPNSTCKGKPS